MLGWLKNLCWRTFACFLSYGAGWIRRSPSGTGAEAWRAVRFSYAHFGEDLIVLELLRKKGDENRGLYVDVGAFDPVLHSNTYLLYLHGWSGINIDASTSRLERFKKARPRDVNVVAAVSDDEKDMLFLEYPTAGTSRLVPNDAADLRNASGESPIETRPMRTRSIAKILHDHLDQTKTVDFLNIDCEGIDTDVLRGWNWQNHRPLVIAVEANTAAERIALESYLEEKGYQLVARCIVTLIFALPKLCERFGAAHPATAARD